MIQGREQSRPFAFVSCSATASDTTGPARRCLIDAAHAVHRRSCSRSALLLLAAPRPPRHRPPAPLTRDSLDALKKSGFQISSDDERNRIALLLPQCLGDPDPAMRDGIAFEALYTWMRASALQPATIRTLAARLTPELRAADDAAGFRKPFVALVLAEVARADRVGSCSSPRRARPSSTAPSTS